MALDIPHDSEMTQLVKAKTGISVRSIYHVEELSAAGG